MRNSAQDFFRFDVDKHELYSLNVGTFPQITR